MFRIRDGIGRRAESVERVLEMAGEELVKGIIMNRHTSHLQTCIGSITRSIYPNSIVLITSPFLFNLCNKGLFFRNKIIS